MDRFTLAQCKEELRKRNAETLGTKAVLLERLRKLLETEGSNLETLISNQENGSMEEYLAPREEVGGGEDVHPEDSVSQASTRSRISSSSCNSIRVTRAMETARKAGLLAKAKVLQEKRKRECEAFRVQQEKEKLQKKLQQEKEKLQKELQEEEFRLQKELQEEEFRLQQEKERLDLEAEIEEATAREKILSDLESEVGSKSRASSSHSVRVKAGLNVDAVAFHPDIGVKDTGTV